MNLRKIALATLLVTQLVSTAKAATIELMSYNVENLFDAEHDEGKDDWSFMPKNAPGKKKECEKIKSKYRRKECLDADWSDQKVEAKINNLADVIQKERKKVPEILALIELENPKVVERLAKKLGFKEFEMTDSPDKRGVDVALLFNTTKDIVKVDKKEHVVAVDYPTRNILEVEFLVGGSPLTIFVNHWPSLSNPDSWRVKAATVLSDRVKEIKKKNPAMNFIAVGDFNTIPENNPHPFRDVLHKEGLFLDTAETFLADKTISEEAKKNLNPGTYYFAPKNQWNSLDRIFYSPNLLDKKDLEIKISSFDIYRASFAMTDWKVYKDGKPKLGGYDMDETFNVTTIRIPIRFNPDAKKLSEIGYSDHLPVRVLIEYPDKAVKK